MQRILIALATVVMLLVGCGRAVPQQDTTPGNKDPRVGYVTFSYAENGLGEPVVWNYKICVGPDLKFVVDNSERWIRKSPECKAKR